MFVVEVIDGQRMMMLLDPRLPEHQHASATFVAKGTSVPGHHLLFYELANREAPLHARARETMTESHFSMRPPTRNMSCPVFLHQLRDYATHMDDPAVGELAPTGEPPRAQALQGEDAKRARQACARVDAARLSSALTALRADIGAELFRLAVPASRSYRELAATMAAAGTCGPKSVRDEAWRKTKALCDAADAADAAADAPVSPWPVGLGESERAALLDSDPAYALAGAGIFPGERPLSRADLLSAVAKRFAASPAATLPAPGAGSQPSGSAAEVGSAAPASQPSQDPSPESGVRRINID